MNTLVEAVKPHNKCCTLQRRVLQHVLFQRGTAAAWHLVEAACHLAAAADIMLQTNSSVAAGAAGRNQPRPRHQWPASSALQSGR